jgi:hypothetical protein
VRFIQVKRLVKCSELEPSLQLPASTSVLAERLSAAFPCRSNSAACSKNVAESRRTLGPPKTQRSGSKIPLNVVPTPKVPTCLLMRMMPWCSVRRYL